MRTARDNEQYHVARACLASSTADCELETKSNNPLSWDFVSVCWGLFSRVSPVFVGMSCHITMFR